MKAIETTNLTKYYGKARGIIDLNLSVDEGDFFGFIGPNGAGKSTTIRILLGLISPTEGVAKIFDKVIIDKKIEILKDIGYLPAETVFYSGMRVKDVLKFSADMRKVSCTNEAEILCERLQLDTTRKIDELSFGNRKKVGIVCALQHKPKLLIFDEPTSGLDPLMQKEFFNILNERNQNGSTIFLSSHVLAEIQHNCNKAAIIRDGKLIACDSVETLANTSAKRITIHGKFNTQKLSGIRDEQQKDGVVSFLYNGDINKLVHILAENKIDDLCVAEPDLEEVFMHYYTSGGDEV